jgi:hypothetical protein
VTEIHVQPAVDTPEVRALGGGSEGWIDDWHLMVDDAEVARALEASGATVLGYRALRDVMRASV